MSESLGQKYERILSLCETGKRYGAFTQMSCPCSGNHKHGDKEKSASLGLHSNGISFKCFAGCQTEDFLKALGLTFKDLFEDSERTPTNIYTYRNADGSYHHDKVKYRKPDGKKDFRQRTIGEDGKVVWTAAGGVPFDYPELIEGIKQGNIVLYVEGEKDALTGKLLGYVSTTMGGASDWKDEFKNFFKGASIILIPDKDDPGLKFTSKMVESLKTVAKSIKTLILPQGKDLTEWVESGNSDLRVLIDSSAIELITKKGVPEPVVKDIVGGYELYWVGLNLSVTIDHIENDDSVEISVYESLKPIYISGYKLLSVSHKEGLVRSLKKLNAKFEWDIIVNQITVVCLSKIREGEPIIWLDDKVGASRPEYLIWPLFVKNNPNIVYADRSSAKSLLLTLIDILLTCNLDFHGLTVNQEHRVLYLDWENDHHTVGFNKQNILRGLGIEGIDVPYLHCNRPLSKSLAHIQKRINEVNADVIIIDSLAVSVGGNTNDSEPAINFFAALRQLPVTPLIIAHTAKDKENKHRTVYGSAFYENLARSIWEISKYQDFGSSELTLSLFQRKSPPFSSYHEPLGFRFSFEEDKTIVSKCEPKVDERNQ
jgi:hypothetical protein